jgi:hypothetical protein
MAGPAFEPPSKPIGPGYSPSKGQRLAAERGWTVPPDGACWRRLVALPEPTRIVERAALRLLVYAGVVVICARGGGIPVVQDERRGLWGVEAVGWDAGSERAPWMSVKAGAVPTRASGRSRLAGAAPGRSARAGRGAARAAPGPAAAAQGYGSRLA